jgi:hypothetical protein
MIRLIVKVRMVIAKMSKKNEMESKFGTIFVADLRIGERKKISDSKKIK